MCTLALATDQTTGTLRGAPRVRVRGRVSALVMTVTWHKRPRLAGVERLARQRPGVEVVHPLVPPGKFGGAAGAALCFCALNWRCSGS